MTVVATVLDISGLGAEALRAAGVRHLVALDLRRPAEGGAVLRETIQTLSDSGKRKQSSMIKTETKR